MRASRYSWERGLLVFDAIPELREIAALVRSALEQADPNHWGWIEVPITHEQRELLKAKAPYTFYAPASQPVEDIVNAWSQILPYLKACTSHDTSRIVEWIEGLLALDAAVPQGDNRHQIFGVTEKDRDAIGGAHQRISKIKLGCHSCTENQGIYRVEGERHGHKWMAWYCGACLWKMLHDTSVKIRVLQDTDLTYVHGYRMNVNEGMPVEE